MKVYAQIILSRDSYIAGVGDDISWISEKTREQYARTIHGMGNCIVGRRAYQVLERQKVILSNAKPAYRRQGSSCILDSSPAKRVQNDGGTRFFDACDDPFIVVLSKHNYPSQPNRHFTDAKPKNILKLLDEKGYSSTVVCGGVQAIQLFMDAGLVDTIIVYTEDRYIGEGIKFSEILLEGWDCIEDYGYKKVYTNNDTSSHSK